MSGENNKIKSAFELAMEKARKLGDLSDEERQKLKDEELREAGDALAKRFLNGLPLRDIVLELAKHEEDERIMISSYAISHLLKEIDISPDTQADKVLTAVEYLSGNTKAVERIKSLQQEYATTLEKNRRENPGALESVKRKELGRIGISGSAVVLAIDTFPEWRGIQQELAAPYYEKLSQLKSLF
jgi:hypothetical protein